MSTETETLVVDQEKVTKKLQAALAFLRKHPDWMAHANAYVMDTYNAPNLMHFMSNGSTLEQKDECADRLIQAIKMGNRGLLGDFDIGGEVKPENEPEPEETPKQEGEPVSEPKPIKNKSQPEPSSDTEPVVDSLENMLVTAVIKRLRNVTVPKDVIEAAVQVVFEQFAQEMQDKFTAEVSAMKEQVAEFTKKTPPRDVFNITVQSNSANATQAVKQIIRPEVVDNANVDAEDDVPW